MADDGKSGVGATLVVPLLIAILSAGSAPWWWSHVSSATSPLASAEARTQSSPQLALAPAQGGQPTPTPALVEPVAAPPRAEPVLAGLVGLPSAMDRYRARLSTADHCNSRGELLSTAAQVIRQDRANYYMEKGDREDSPMAELSTPDARQGLEARVVVDAETARTIKSSTPLVEVEKTASGFTVRIVAEGQRFDGC